MALAEALKITAEEYRLMPETGPRYQLIEGELCMAPAPDRYHQDISRNLEFLLLKYLEQNPIGVLYHAPFAVYLGEHDVFQPDICFILNARRSILTKAGAEGAPDFIVEILSPKTAKLDKVPKKKVYAAAGVKELWIIDPVRKVIDVFELQNDPDQPARSHSGNTTFASPLFPGLKFRTAEIFKA
jgi:Uma2 family endonuclease